MKILLHETKLAFDVLIDERKRREEIADWAFKVQLAQDDDVLEYDPPEEEDRIWESIDYLTGVDLKSLDGNYLHSLENFIDFRDRMGF